MADLQPNLFLSLLELFCFVYTSEELKPHAFCEAKVLFFTIVSHLQISTTHFVRIEIFNDVNKNYILNRNRGEKMHRLFIGWLIGNRICFSLCWNFFASYKQELYSESESRREDA
jgi:hypothetical protein